MNSITGKSTGIALLMAAALIAALFAMGVFSAGTVGAHPDDDDVDDNGGTTSLHDIVDTLAAHVEQHDELDPSGAAFAIGNVGDDDTFNADADNAPTLAPEFNQDIHAYTLTMGRVGTVLQVTVDGDASGDGADGVTQDEITVMVNGAEIGPATVATAESADPLAFQVDLTEQVVETITITADDEDATGDDVQAAGVYTITVNNDLATGKTTPGSNQSLKVQFDGPLGDTDDINVKLAKFGVPSSIDTDDVSVALVGQDGDDSTGEPSDIEVDGTTVTLVGPLLNNDGDAIAALAGDDDFTGATITFKRGAGITLPILHDDYDVEVTNDEGDDDGVQNWVTVRRQVTVKPASGKRGTEITITAKGYSDNTHDIVIGSGNYSLTKSADATDGVITLKVDTSVKNNEGNSVFRGPFNTETEIKVGDASGTFTIKASFSWSPEIPTPGQDITITLSDIDPDNTGAEGDPLDTSLDVKPTITIGGQEVQGVANAKDDKRSTWKGQVHGDTSLGNRKIEVSVGNTDLSAQNITIGTNDLTVTPTTVVPRQTISIDGDGFTPRGEVDLTKVTVDGVQIETETGETEAVNNNGNISFDVSVPETVSSGPATVKVVDDGDRVGTVQITIAKAEISVSPGESLRGETITVSGTGFPANDLVLIEYNGDTVDTSNTSPTGTFEQDVTVPASENINPGGKYKVKAISQVNEDDVSDDADHKIRGPEITISPDTAVAGSNVTINGSNFKGFLRVHSIEIGGQDVTPVPAPSTDKWGAFTAASIQVPQLDATRHAVKVVVGAEDGSDGDATEFMTVVTGVVSTDPADVFASLIADGSLSTVWHLDASTQSWTSFSTNPALADFNDLTEIQGNQVYVLIMSAAGEFQGKALFAGTNQVFIP